MLARLRAFLVPEEIGHPDCPILNRWTIWPIGWRTTDKADEEHRRMEELSPVKVMVHHFLPNADDRDVHDHPRSFWTFVLRGGYDDLAPCGCDDELEGGMGSLAEVFRQRGEVCHRCDGSTVVLRERMTAGMIRRRPANHKHRTRVHPSGCWTIVVMGPLQRQWGFWRAGRFYKFRDYERIFGFGMRCD